MNRDIVILTSRNKFFGQTRKPWSSLDVDQIAALLAGHGWKVEQHDFHQVVNQAVDLKGRTIFYAFSQKDNYRQYINDIVYHLSKNNRVIPSYDLLKCHENKGYQEIFKKTIGLNGLVAQYHTSGDEVNAESLKYPVVLKTTQGTNGKGVVLIRNYPEFLKQTKLLGKKLGLRRKLDLFRRKYLRKKKFIDYPDYSDRQDYLEYREYLKHEQNFILQEYVPGLDFDYRVLVACDRYYVMKRSVKKGDFRASGTKKFSFSKTPDPALLEYARSVYRMFDTPFLSLDILFNGTQYFVGEFQALHFGMSVVARSDGYFKALPNENWTFVEDKPHLENLVANTLVEYLK
ncbi:MAG: hypothetical protein RBS53_08990 [Bacteroidales bacterium]|nr:hypothetical protein [Bacteroidales bacterium]NLM91678.1 hypothetical protein [Bacteroidales bacterium]